jgi:hypothetical protein
MRRNKVGLVTVAIIATVGCTQPVSQNGAMVQSPNWKAGFEPAEGMDGQGSTQTEPKILPQTHLAAAQLLEAKGMIDDAIAQYQKAIAANHHYAEAYQGLAVMLSRVGRNREAVEAMTKAATIRPEDAAIQNNLGYMLMREQQWAQAISHLQKATALKPYFARAHVNLGMCYSKMGQFDDAFESFKTVLPEADARYNMGLMYRGQQKFTEAAREFRMVLEINPLFTAASAQLTEIEPYLPANQRSTNAGPGQASRSTAMNNMAMNDTAMDPVAPQQQVAPRKQVAPQPHFATERQAAPQPHFATEQQIAPKQQTAPKQQAAPEQQAAPKHVADSGRPQTTSTSTMQLMQPVSEPARTKPTTQKVTPTPKKPVTLHYRPNEFRQEAGQGVESTADHADGIASIDYSIEWCEEEQLREDLKAISPQSGLITKIEPRRSMTMAQMTMAQMTMAQKTVAQKTVPQKSSDRTSVTPKSNAPKPVAAKPTIDKSLGPKLVAPKSTASGKTARRRDANARQSVATKPTIDKSLGPKPVAPKSTASGKTARRRDNQLRTRNTSSQSRQPDIGQMTMISMQPIEPEVSMADWHESAATTDYEIERCEEILFQEMLTTITYIAPATHDEKSVRDKAIIEAIAKAQPETMAMEIDAPSRDISARGSGPKARIEPNYKAAEYWEVLAKSEAECDDQLVVDPQESATFQIPPAPKVMDLSNETDPAVMAAIADLVEIDASTIGSRDSSLRVAAEIVARRRARSDITLPELTAMIEDIREEISCLEDRLDDFVGPYRNGTNADDLALEYLPELEAPFVSIQPADQGTSRARTSPAQAKLPESVPVPQPISTPQPRRITAKPRNTTAQPRATMTMTVYEGEREKLRPAKRRGMKKASDQRRTKDRDENREEPQPMRPSGDESSQVPEFDNLMVMMRLMADKASCWDVRTVRDAWARMAGKAGGNVKPSSSKPSRNKKIGAVDRDRRTTMRTSSKATPRSQGDRRGPMPTSIRRYQLGKRTHNPIIEPEGSY